jgi:hypothetical protein
MSVIGFNISGCLSWKRALYSSFLFWFRFAREHLVQGFAIQLDTIEIVKRAVEGAVSNGGVANLLVPVGHRHLRGEAPSSGVDNDGRRSRESRGVHRLSMQP